MIHLEYRISAQSSTHESRASVTVSLLGGPLNHYIATYSPGLKTAPNVPNKGARRGAKCASAAHEGGAPLGFQPVHTPGQTRRSSRGVGDIPDTASSPRRQRYRGAHASQPLSQPPARYRPLDLNFSTLQCSTVLLYDLGIYCIPYSCIPY